MLALFSCLAREHPDYRWLFGRMNQRFAPTSIQVLYSRLLGEGRVWDLHGLFNIWSDYSDHLNESLRSLFGFSDTRNILSKVIEDWQIPDYDESTNLALLGILSEKMMSLMSFGHDVEAGVLGLSLQLAQSFMRNDPSNMKSRPFTRWILIKATLEEAKSANVFKSVWENLLSSKGIGINHPANPFPQYVPVYGENPRWKMEDAQAQYRDAVKLVVNTSRDACDYRTEIWALIQLVRLSSNPEEEFDRLCHLQKNVAGDLLAYEDTLATSYLIRRPERLADELKHEIIDHFKTTRSSALCYCSDTRWALSMLLYSLEDKKEQADKALQTAYYEYRYISRNLQILLEDKFPHHAEWMNGHTRSRRLRVIDRDLPPWEHIWQNLEKRTNSQRRYQSPPPPPPPPRPRRRSRSRRRVKFDNVITRDRSPRSRTPMQERELGQSSPIWRAPSPPLDWWPTKDPAIEQGPYRRHRDIDSGKINAPFVLN